MIRKESDGNKNPKFVNIHNHYGSEDMITEIEAIRKLYPKDAIDLNMLFSQFETFASNDKRYKVFFITFSSQEEPTELIMTEKPPNYEIREKKHENFSLFELKKIIKKKEEEEYTIEGYFGLYQAEEEDIWTIFTTENRDFIYGVIKPLLNSLRPNVSLTYISSDEMEKLFDELEEKLDCEIIINKAILYSRIKEAMIDFQKKNYFELFDQARNEDEYIDKIEFTVYKKRSGTFHGFISREGILYYSSGNISGFYNNILRNVEKISAKKFMLFKGKERKIGAEENILNPIEIKFSKEIFLSIEDNFRFLHAVNQLERCGITVFHNNPYLHFSILDFYDGSSFDVFSTGVDKVTIIPSFKSSVHSLNRICDAIFKRIKEGQISDIEGKQSSS